MAPYRFALRGPISDAILARNRSGIYVALVLTGVCAGAVLYLFQAAHNWTLAVWALLNGLLVIDYVRTAVRIRLGTFGSCESEITQIVRVADALKMDGPFKQDE